MPLLSMDLALRIELFLLERGGFVCTKELCEHFELCDRDLRAKEGKCGLLDDFAVSSTSEGAHGFIHHRHLQEQEWKKIENRLRSHGIAELKKVRHWRLSRHNCLTGKRPDLREVHGGQGMLFAV